MYWRKTIDWIFWFLAPKGWLDTSLKMAIIIIIILASQLIFTQLYLDDIPQQIPYYFWCALFVGGPWVSLFFLIASYQIRLQKKLSVLSRKDGLTGLNNRRTFFEMTNRRNHSKSGGVLLMIDADNFKTINDTYGHAAGDECLKSIAYRVNRNLRETDVAGRIGGEEFAVFLTGANLAQARVIAERLLTPIAFSSPVTEECLTVTLSIGGIEAQRKNTLDQLLMGADEALYHAKSSGKAQLVMWTKSLNQATSTA